MYRLTHEQAAALRIRLQIGVLRALQDSGYLTAARLAALLQDVHGR